ncbi:MAG: MFS transporter [Meiothermus sp.]|uniref:MFS transporter n=1 Tax=Meiothermus sp. TaxID=1955249 RepID=UPI0025EDEAB5|nr:MFS transporter [Meiothermus sp.]MCS7058010.1 MFS transporter [Meiothermus sp.]MCS7195118.1 MFS transporter [Meiothermus sp.]MCX7740766.1 MFS transporter [Meiothermus sp.]MDW8091385.1 MFS transporter [Meiothermus sp.]MDW8482487.1 MFS transporter [Meiothermus sp.]
MKMLEKLPWKQKALPQFGGILLTLGLIEMSRSAFFWVFLPFSSKELGLSLSLIGLAWVVHSLAEAFSRGLGGYLVQRLGFGLVAAFAGLVGLLTVVGTVSYPNGWLFLSSTLVWGMATSALQPGYLTYSSRVAVPGREGRAMAYAHFLVMPWIGLGWVLGTFFTRHLPETSAPMLLIALGLATLLGLANLRLREPIPKQGFRLSQLLPILVVVPVAFAQTFLQTLFNLVILKFTFHVLLFTEWQLYLAIGLAAATAFVGTGFFGRLPDRRGPLLPMVGSLGVLALVFVLIAQKPTYGQFLGLCLLGGAAFATFVPSWNAFLVRLLPVENRAAIWGSLMVVEGLGAATGPAVGGFLWDWLGPRGPFLGGALVCLGLVVFYLALWRLGADRR